MSVSFARMAARYREEARALESMRHVIGWNYCGFFVVKEGLAFTYLKASSRRMILMALAIYRELAEHYQSLPDATRIEYFYTPLPAAASSTATTATTSTAGSSPASESSLPSGGGGGGEFTDEASIAELQDDCCVPLSLWCNNSFRMMIYRNSNSSINNSHPRSTTVVVVASPHSQHLQASLDQVAPRSGKLFVVVAPRSRMRWRQLSRIKRNSTGSTSASRTSRSRTTSNRAFAIVSWTSSLEILLPCTICVATMHRRS